MYGWRWILFTCLLMSGWALAEAPVNDDRVNAVEISTGVVIGGTLAGATVEEGEPKFLDGVVRTVWFRWVAEVEGRWEVRVRSELGPSAAMIYREEIGGELRVLAYPGFRQFHRAEDTVGGIAQGSHGSRVQGEVGEVFDTSVVEVWRGEAITALESASVTKFPPPTLKILKARRGEEFWIRISSEDERVANLTISRATEGDFFDESINFGKVETFRYERNLCDLLTLEPGEPEFYSAGSQWLHWEAPVDGQYEVRASIEGATGGDSYRQPLSIVNLFRGETVQELVEITKYRVAHNGNILRFFAAKGDRVRFQTGYYARPPASSNVYDGTGERPPKLMVTELHRLPDPPPNDDFANADDLGRGMTGQVRGTNAGATLDEGEILDPTRVSDSAWTKWEAPATADFELRMVSETSLRVALMKGSEIANLEQIRSGTIGGVVTPNETRFRFRVVEGEVYYLRVTGGYDGEQGGYEIFF